MISTLRSSLLSLSPSPQSFAQICDDDVLSIIFEDLRHRDLYSAALTCKRWTPAAYRALYSSLVFCALYREGTHVVDLLSRTLIARPTIRSLIRRLSVSSLDPCFNDGRPSPDPLYDWLPLLPSDTITSLYVCTGAGEHFLSQLLRSPMLKSIQHLGLTASEPCYIGRNLMSELLSLAPKVSQVAINLPRSGNTPMLQAPSDLYAPFFPRPRHIRHITVYMWAFTPLFTNLLRAAQNSLESLHCQVGHHFHQDFRHALLTYTSSPLHTLHVHSRGMFPNTLLLTHIPDAWTGMRELVFPGFTIPSHLFQSLPISLETLGVGLSYEPTVPWRELREFIETAAELHPSFRRLIVFCVDRLRDLNDLPGICDECGVSLEAYGLAIQCQSPADPDGAKLETILEGLPLTTK